MTRDTGSALILLDDAVALVSAGRTDRSQPLPLLRQARDLLKDPGRRATAGSPTGSR